MPKLSELLERPDGAIPNPPGLAKPFSRFGRSGQLAAARPGLLAAILGLAVISALSGIQLYAFPGLDLRSLYFVVCVAVGWFAGSPAALLCAVISTAFGTFSQKANWNSAPFVFGVNTAFNLAGSAGLGWLAAKLAIEARLLKHNLGQGTASLEQEVQQHEETSDLLREAIQLFRQVTDNIADVFWVTDPSKTKVEYVSPGFELVFGKACQTLLNSPNVWFDAIHHEDRERVTGATFAKQIRGDYDEEYRVVRLDGSLRWVHDRAFPVKDANGAVFRLVGITEDITERKRAEHLMQAERDIGAALSSTNDLNFALDRLLEIAMQLEGIDCGGVYLADSQSGTLHLEAHCGLSGSFIRRVSGHHPDTIEAELARKGEATYLRSELIPRSLEVLWGSEGLRALAIVPIQHKGVVLGILNLGSYSQDEILPRTRAGIEMIASQVAGAIARIRAEESQRRTEQQILEISDREQARLGQDLHDGLCQLLIGMAFKLNSLEQTLSAQAHAGAPNARKLRDLLNEAIEESRRVSRGLYPIRLSTQGLVPALEELALAASQRYAIACACEAEGEPVNCDIATATHLYRIAQEAMNNALKHAGAKHIQIRLTNSVRKLTLEICDDGKGLKPEMTPSSGMGMHIMNYRARLISASLTVRSGETGTAVSCSMPQNV